MIFGQIVEATHSETLQIVQIVCTTVGAIFAGVIGYLTLKLNKKANEVVSNTRDVQSTLATNNVDRNEKLETLKVVGEKTNELIVDNQITQLKDKAELTRKLCKATRDPIDCKDAEAAEQAYQEALKKKGNGTT